MPKVKVMFSKKIRMISDIYIFNKEVHYKLIWYNYNFVKNLETKIWLLL